MDPTFAATDRSSLRWGEDAPETIDEARERIVDAAERCIERFGASKTTIEDVASEARISRATVYRYFANRDEIMLAVLARAFDRTEHRILRAVWRPRAAKAAEMSWANIGDVKPYQQVLVDAFLAMLREVPKDPTMRLMFGDDAGPEMARLVGSSEVFFLRTVERLMPILDQARAAGLLRDEVDERDAAEWVERLCMSFLAFPSPVKTTEARIRHMLETLLVPALFKPSANA
jgi:AcrR family transcriptional regulator